MTQSHEMRAILLCAGLLWSTLTPASARSLGPAGQVSGDKDNQLVNKLHVLGQLLLQCLASFDSSGQSEQPVILGQNPEVSLYSTDPVASKLRSMNRQMRRQLKRCRELQVGHESLS